MTLPSKAALLNQLGSTANAASTLSDILAHDKQLGLCNYQQNLPHDLVYLLVERQVPNYVYKYSVFLVCKSAKSSCPFGVNVKHQMKSSGSRRLKPSHRDEKNAFHYCTLSLHTNAWRVARSCRMSKGPGEPRGLELTCVWCHLSWPGRGPDPGSDKVMVKNDSGNNGNRL